MLHRQTTEPALLPGFWDRQRSLAVLQVERWVSITAALCVQVAFVLPTTYPVTRETLNYSGVAVGIVMVGAVLVWFLPSIGARHWYRGEIQTYKPDAEQVPPPKMNIAHDNAPI